MTLFPKKKKLSILHNTFYNTNDVNTVYDKENVPSTFPLKF